MEGVETDALDGVEKAGLYEEPVPGAQTMLSQIRILGEFSYNAESAIYSRSVSEIRWSKHRTSRPIRLCFKGWVASMMSQRLVSCLN